MNEQTFKDVSRWGHTATHYNTLHHTAPYCNALQCAATHCNTLQNTATHCNIERLLRTCRDGDVTETVPVTLMANLALLQCYIAV